MLRALNNAPVAVFHRTNKAVNVGLFEIPEDSLIITNLGEILNDPEHFPDPQEFRPERFLTNEIDGSLRFTPHQRMGPFGIGQNSPIEDKYTTGFVLVPQPYKLKFRKL